MSGERGLALITGASQGIGAALAVELARRGHAVLVVARSAEKLEAVRKEAAAANGGRAHALALDLLVPGAVDRLVAHVAELRMPLTCLVNNAGQGLWGLFGDLTLEEQRRMMRLNMDVPVELTHRLLPLLKSAERAYILNIASMVAHHALASMAIYSGSKAFMLRWSRSLRIELRGTGVGVTCVSPGSVITGFTERAGMQAMDDLARKFGTPPGPVAKAAVDAMLRGRPEVVPGLMNAIASRVQGWLPAGMSEMAASGIYLKRLRSRKG